MRRTLLACSAFLLLACETEARAPRAGEPIAISPAADADTVLLPAVGSSLVAADVNRAADPSACDRNYSPCVPIDRDVDCAGGSGNGPSYVRGPVRVTGRDVYDLDRDGDRIGCDR